MFGRLIGGVATTVLVVAALSLACWFAFAAITGASLITFRTGSMAPTMPQGAIAVTMPTPANALAVGDVITVQRIHEELPVTHRIIDIDDSPTLDSRGPELRAFAPGIDPSDAALGSDVLVTMQGDDNTQPDRLPYLISDARRVVFALPYAGNLIMLLQSPIGMGALLIGLGTLTTWAFWPRSTRGKGSREIAVHESELQDEILEEDPSGTTPPQTSRAQRVHS